MTWETNTDSMLLLNFKTHADTSPMCSLSKSHHQTQTFDYLLAQRTLHPCWQFSTSTSAFTSSTFQWGPSVKAWAMTPQRSWRMNIIYLQCQTMRMKRMAVAKQVENVTSHLHNTAASISIHTYFSKPHTQSTHHPRWHKDFAWARRPTQCWARRPTNSRCEARTLTTYYNIFSMIFALL